MQILNIICVFMKKKISYNPSPKPMPPIHLRVQDLCLLISIGLESCRSCILFCTSVCSPFTANQAKNPSYTQYYNVEFKN